ncbi:MAG: hypothetical protein V7K18_27815 [Nostoc sp.]|uniref:hypothetical protein n=1 Tax=Nostoc sp. TaxID=1180 RepID=UPI002FF86FCC
MKSLQPTGESCFERRAAACRKLLPRRREASAPLRFPDLKQLARHRGRERAIASC